MNKQRIVFLDYLRLIAAFAVIVVHIVAQKWYSTSVDSLEWQIFNCYDSIVRWAVPVFVMISGALFLGKEHSVKRIYTKNIFRIVVTFVFWSAIYILLDSLLLNTNYSFKEMVTNFLIGKYHLWFLFMIVGLYLVVPILNKIVNDKKIAWYFVFLSFLFAFFIPQCSNIIELKSHGISSMMNEMVSKLKLHLPLGFSGYYVLGYLLFNSDIKKKKQLIIYILGIIGLVLTITSTSFLSVGFKTPLGIFYDDLSVNTLMVSVAVFVFAKSHFNNCTLLHKKNALFFLSKCSFGVYLIHVFIIEFLDKNYFDTIGIINPILSIPIFSVIVYLISFLLSAILNKIPIVNKWIV